MSLQTAVTPVYHKLSDNRTLEAGNRISDANLLLTGHAKLSPLVKYQLPENRGHTDASHCLGAGDASWHRENAGIIYFIVTKE